MKPHIDELFKRNIALADHTTFRIGGPARFFCRVHSADAARWAIGAALREHLPWQVIGEGSNILANDELIDRAIIAFVSDEPPRLGEDDVITVSGGASLNALIDFCTEHGFEGMEKLAGIPGTVGGAIAGNAGAYGMCASQHLESVELIMKDGSVITALPDQLAFTYRSSRLKITGDVVLEARYRLRRGSTNALRRAVLLTKQDRRSKHPDYRRYPTAGSFFKNIEPADGTGRRIAVGRLLDELGAKNVRVGGAGLWHNHANIIVNYGNATARDVRQLASDLHRRVYDRFGISLEPEVTFLE